MVTFEFRNGFTHIYRDGVEVAHTGDPYLSLATLATGLRCNALERVCAWLGGDVLAAYRREYPAAPSHRRRAPRHYGGCW